MAQSTPDWSLIESFLAVQAAGSLSGAARALERSQPTLGRHIEALELALGVPLFDRQAGGMALTAAGAELLPEARAMQAAMHRLTLAAAGREARLEGTVRITASVFGAHYVLPPILAQLRAEEPAIDIELVATDAPQNLLFRDADIAVRMFRPEQLEVVTRHVTDLEIACFAATSYLARRGRPASIEDLRHHDLIGYDTSDLILRETRRMGVPLQREDFALRCDNHAAYWQLLRHGCGIGFSQANVGRPDPLVEEIDLGLDLPSLPVWLTAHPRMRETPRVRRVWDVLDAGFSGLR